MSTQVKRLGILGSGQLGRMLALAAAPLGIECAFYDEATGAPCVGLGPITEGKFTDEDALMAFAHECDLVTYEFENVPYSSAQCIEKIVPVYPPPAALEVAQDRSREKSFFQSLNISTPTFQTADCQASLSAAISAIGMPCVVKTRRMGYDGKGQAVVKSADDVHGLWERLGGVPLIVEQWITFDRELSVLAARNAAGQIMVYPLAYNIHKEGILRRSEIPAPAVSPGLQESGRELISRVMQALNYVGVLTIELFDVQGRLVANEMAPRVHNSGHATMDGSVCS